MEAPLPYGGRQCTANSKQSGKRCRRAASPGKDVCPSHGSKSLEGPAHPNWRHGKRSQMLSRIGLGAAYEAAMADPNLGSLREQIALCEARIEELLERLTGESKSHHWQLAGRLIGECQNGTAPNRAKALARLQAVIEAGARDEGTWAQLGEQMELRRKLTDTEGKNLERLHQTLTAEQAMALMSRLVVVIKRHVTDRGALAEISREMRVLSVGSGAHGH